MKKSFIGLCLANTLFLSSVAMGQSTQVDAETLQTQESSPQETSPQETSPQETVSEEELQAQQYLAWAESFVSSLTPMSGNIVLPGDKATLNVPDNYYYLSPQDSKRVLEEAWGNPEGDLTLGMLFPSKYSVLDGEAWGVTIEYVEEGYVSDEDAEDIDYAELLLDMQADTQESSEWRVQQGYPAIDLVGWAEAPYYDKSTHKLYWAKELKFGESEENTLNYNVRALGRQGYLVMNFIAGMSQLNDINSAREEVLAMASFNDGHKYSEFDPEIDNVAAYGIGGLIAGKVLAKTGFFALALVFLKKFWFVLFLPLVWLKGKFFPKKEPQ